jgi:hypothetical protein
MEVKNFAILRGNRVQIEKGVVKLSPPETMKKEIKEGNNIKMKEEPGPIPLNEIRSDISFSNGIIEFKFKTSSFETGILLLFKTPVSKGAAIGFSLDQDTFLISKDPVKLDAIVSAGSFKNYKLNQEYLMKVEVNGSNARLFMDHVLLCEASLIVSESPIQLRLSTGGNLDIYDFKVFPKRPKVFVVMQFSKEYNELFEDVIKPVSEECGFDCVRADEFYTSTPILKDIIESIEQSTAIIAEITPDNPNVFYEIGYSHAISKPTILLCDQGRTKLPFDVSSFRTLFYENTIAGKKKVESNLRKYLEKIK